MLLPDSSDSPRSRSPRSSPWLASLAWTLIAVSASAVPLVAGEVELELSRSGGEPVADAVLSAVPFSGAALPEPGPPAVMDQRDKSYVPHVLPVQSGAVVSFTNNDSIGHHVYSFSPPKRFDFYLSKGEAHGPVRFDEPGVVAVGCNVHDWMLAYVVVLETPWFGKTGADGRVVLRDLPAGRYRLVVWHPRIHPEEPRLEREIAIEGEGRETWRIVLRKPLLPDRSQEPRFPDYGR